jgi:hypothetical protein
MRLLILGLFSLALAVVASACGGRANVQCEMNSNCDLSGGGVCTEVNDHHWCAYPDPGCPSGYRYSDLDIGDGLSGMCTAAGQTFMLTVTISGDGSGTITSKPDGLQCSGATCTGVFATGTQVALMQAATSGAFLGWSGDCTGFGACTVTLDQDRNVGAFFGMKGEGLWVVQVGGTGDESAYSVATTSDGNLIAVGQFENTVMVGQQSITSHGSTDVYVAKLESATGNVLWAKAIGSMNGETVANAVVDNQDNIYIAGTYAGTIDLGGGNMLTGYGANDAMVMKLTPTGDIIWARGFGGTDYDYGDSVAVNGNTVAFSMRYRSSMTVAGSTYTAAYFDIFVVALSATDGSITWDKSVGSSGIDIGYAIQVDGDNNVVLTGRMGNTIDFGGGPVDTGGNAKGFIAKYNGATGAYLLAKALGNGSGVSQINSAVVDSSKNVLTVGAFTGTIDFGNGSPITSTNTSGDIFAAKYSAAGALDWVKTYTNMTGNPASPIFVNADAAGNVAFTGNFCGTINFGGSNLSSASACPNNDVFVVRLAGADGAHIDSIRAGGQGDEYGQGVAQTSDGRVFVSGRFQGFADFAGQALTCAGNDDAYILGLAPL